jgi:hypothetical protein
MVLYCYAIRHVDLGSQVGSESLGILGASACLSTKIRPSLSGGSLDLGKIDPMKTKSADRSVSRMNETLQVKSAFC